MPPKQTEVDFWRRVNKTAGCWYWTGSFRKSDGRPLASHEGYRDSARRIAYELVTGEDTSSRYIFRRCKTPSCINPAHMRVGLALQDQADAIRREYFAGGITQAELAKRYGVERSTMTRLINRRSG